jgi:hypothetical protein
MKIGDKLKIENCDEAWIGWMTKTSYLICYIVNIFDENKKISSGWLWSNLRVKWILKKDLRQISLGKLIS